MDRRENSWGVWMCVCSVGLGICIGGCEPDNPGAFIPYYPQSSIEFRSSGPLPVASPDSEAVLAINAVVRDQNGIALSGYWVRFTDLPHFGWFEPDSVFTVNGSATSQYHFIIPHDTVNVTIEVQSGGVSNKITFRLHGS